MTTDEHRTWIIIIVVAILTFIGGCGITTYRLKRYITITVYMQCLKINNLQECDKQKEINLLIIRNGIRK